MYIKLQQNPHCRVAKHGRRKKKIEFQEMKYFRPLARYLRKLVRNDIIRNEFGETRILEDIERYKLQWRDRLLRVDFPR